MSVAALIVIIMLAVVALVFGGIFWLNRHAAVKIEAAAKAIAA